MENDWMFITRIPSKANPRRTSSEAMRWGSANAASVVEHIGAREGLLTREALEQRLVDCPECQVEERT